MYNIPLPPPPAFPLKYILASLPDIPISKASSGLVVPIPTLLLLESIANVVESNVASPVNAGAANGAFNAKLLVIVVEKLASSLSAAASSLSVSSAAGAESTNPATSLST